MFGILVAATGFAQTELKIVAESSNFEATSMYSDVLQFIDKLKKQSKLIGVENIGYTVEGKEIPMLIMSNPLPKKPSDLQNDSRIVFYIQANIHAGEVEGKEASLMFARDLLQPKYSELLKKVVFLIVPNLNADGNDHASENNRTNQNGPKVVGVRHNGAYLDMNRDGLKLETPEMSAVISQVINRWNPEIVLDCHTTNGVYRQEPVTFSWMANPNGNRELINYMRDKLMPAVAKQLHETYKIENCFYGEFNNMQYPDSGYVQYAAEPRYFVNYMGIRNRLAVLNENFVYAPFKDRVWGCYYLMFSLTDMAIEQKESIKKMIASAENAQKTKFSGAASADSFAIKYKGIPTPEKILVRTYKVEPYTDENGRRRMKKTEDKLDVMVDYIADYVAIESVVFPFAYIMNVPDAKVLENLKKHGIIVERLSEKQSFSVEEFNFTELKPEQRLNQGHYNNLSKGAYKTINKEFEKDTYIIRTSQSLGNLVVYLFEPLSDDGYVFWNFFDKYLTPQWGRGFYPYPVYKLGHKTEIKSYAM